MRDTLERSPTPLRDVLYALSLAKPVPDAELLDEFVRRYPDYSEALTEFAIELAVEPYEADPSSSSLMSATSVSVSRAMSRFHNRLYSVRQDAIRGGNALPPTAANPFILLDRAALRDLGARLGASNAFIMKLRDRRIRPETIPNGFRRLLASEMELPIDIVAAHLASPPEIHRGAYFKSDQKPELGEQQSFEEAVRSSGMSVEQRDRLLSI